MASIVRAPSQLSAGGHYLPQRTQLSRQASTRDLVTIDHQYPTDAVAQLGRGGAMSGAAGLIQGCCEVIAAATSFRTRQISRQGNQAENITNSLLLLHGGILTMA
jgi:hypothetical protein